jgi:hypothetical protein
MRDVFDGMYYKAFSNRIDDPVLFTVWDYVKLENISEFRHTLGLLEGYIIGKGVADSANGFLDNVVSSFGFRAPLLQDKPGPLTIDLIKNASRRIRDYNDKLLRFGIDYIDRISDVV